MIVLIRFGDTKTDWNQIDEGVRLLLTIAGEIVANRKDQFVSANGQFTLRDDRLVRTAIVVSHHGYQVFAGVT